LLLYFLYIQVKINIINILYIQVVLFMFDSGCLKRQPEPITNNQTLNQNLILMNVRFCMRFSRFLCTGILLLVSCSLHAQVKASNLGDVDPAIGGVGLILEPTRPLAHLPNSMLRMHPLKKDQLDDQVGGFPLTVISHRTGSAFLFIPLYEEDSFDSKITIHKEITTPYFYELTDEKFFNTVSFSPAAKSGFFRLKNANQSTRFRFRLSVMNAAGKIERDGENSLTGEEDFNGMKVYFYAKTNGKITKFEKETATGKPAVTVTLNAGSEEFDFKYGISFISVARAKQNLEKEIAEETFVTIKTKARTAWEKVLNLIQVSGGTEAQKRTFFTALYRTYERMVDINEYGAYYSAYDHHVHTSDAPFYVDNWIWDSYIALQPLTMILDPDKDQAMIRSYVEMYKQTGWMPSFAVTFGDWPAMVGNHAAVWMADSWNKGQRDFDVKSAYEGLRKNSLEATLLPWRNGVATSLDVFFNKNGYMPALAPGKAENVKEVDAVWEKRQAVSVTLENSYSDWCIAQLAGPAGYPDEKELFLKRSDFYRNVFRKDKGMVWPKDDRGNWIEPYNPKLSGREYFTENNAYIYNWHVKHDLNNLIELMGGPKNAEAKLDQLFREDLSLPKWKFWANQPDASGLVGQFVMGNEPGLHIPYLYNYLGCAWKTQKRIRMLMNTWFTANVFGMPGDEDGGAMSAFVVFSMMGFFQVTPGVPVYTIGSPSFQNVSIQLPNGKKFSVVAKNNSKLNVYIQEAKMNGKPLVQPMFTHSQLLKGGTLELLMGDKPNKQWGVRSN
jgi:predicted alpha-1,2-mannosidase